MTTGPVCAWSRHPRPPIPFRHHWLPGGGREFTRLPRWWHPSVEGSVRRGALKPKALNAPEKPKPKPKAQSQTGHPGPRPRSSVSFWRERGHTGQARKVGSLYHLSSFLAAGKEGTEEKKDGKTPERRGVLAPRPVLPQPGRGGSLSASRAAASSGWCWGWILQRKQKQKHATKVRKPTPLTQPSASFHPSVSLRSLRILHRISIPSPSLVTYHTLAIYTSDLPFAQRQPPPSCTHPTFQPSVVLAPGPRAPYSPSFRHP